MEMSSFNFSFSVGITGSLRLAFLSSLKRARFRRNITSALKMEKDFTRRHRLWKIANKLFLPAIKRIDKIRQAMTDGREFSFEY